MLPLHLQPPPGEPLSVLVIGAHPDDIEIGAGGTLLRLAESRLRARYVVLTGTAERQQEARHAARSFLPDADLTINLFDLPEGRLPAPCSLPPFGRGAEEAESAYPSRHLPWNRAAKT